MGLYKQKFNTRSGQFNLVPSNAVISFKESVASAAALPAGGNAENDARITDDTGHLYVWSGTAWVDQGDMMDLNWSAIDGKPSSAVADIDNAVSIRHSPDTDKYLTTMVTNVLYVDNKRTDVYTSNGSITKPFLTIQAAIDAIPAGGTMANHYEVRIASGKTYTEALTLNKGFTTLIGDSTSRWCGLSGAITVTSLGLCFQRLRITGGVTLSLGAAFLLEVKDCRVQTTGWSITQTDPTKTSYFQVTGNTLWQANITCVGIKGTLGFVNGVFQGGTWNITNSYLQVAGALLDSVTFNLEAGTVAEFGGNFAERCVTNLKTGATLDTDAIFLGGITLNNTGGTLNRITKASNIDNDSSVTGDTVKDALETLGAILPLPGPMGTTGAASTIPGPTGTTGAPGLDGSNGVDGTTGAPGLDGVDGIDGTTGATGTTGASNGLPNPPGADGEYHLVISSGVATWVAD